LKENFRGTKMKTGIFIGTKNIFNPISYKINFSVTPATMR